MNQSKKSIFITVLVAAMGYFVDIYDLLLFGIVRIPSLRAIGVAEKDLMDVGILLINSQMVGLLFGGLLWGILGDKKGRLSVLFGSILLYSLANLANPFVTTAGQYAWLRFVAGIGLAGELGAAITLVAELLPKETRGFGTTIVASVGILGAVLASFVGDQFSWRVAYWVGGGMGLFLLILRLKMLESGLYHEVQKKGDVVKGDVLMLFRSSRRFWKYLQCILIGVPIWFVIGILITFSPELGRALNVQGPISASTSIMICYLALSLGDVCSGLLSQAFKSRRRVVGLFILLTAIGLCLFVGFQGLTSFQFYAICGFLGFATGYWAIFITVAAEQFGTNLRATVATTVPNFVRGAVVPLTLSFRWLADAAGWGLILAATAVGAVTLIFAGVALWRMQETFAKDLNYVEDPREV